MTKVSYVRHWRPPGWRGNLSDEMVAVMFADAIVEGRINPIWLKPSGFGPLTPVIMAVLLERVGDIQIRRDT